MHIFSFIFSLHFAVWFRQQCYMHSKVSILKKNTNLADFLKMVLKTMCCLKCILSNPIHATSLQIVSAKFSNNISHTCVYYFLFSAKLNANNFHLHLAKNVWLRIEVSPITQLQNCVLETSFFDRKSDLKLRR